MTNRIIDISEGGCHLRIEDRQLVIERKDQDAAKIPASDIAALVVGSSWVTYTHSVLSLIAECGGVVVIGDSRGLPAALSLPLFGRSLQAQKLRQQIDASLPLKKRLWQKIISQKILNQGLLLQHLQGDDAGLIAKSKLVKSGDTENLEGQAARIYWNRVFNDLDFRRTPGEGEKPNHFLDYGYAVLRGIVARSICASGLNPTLGIHHQNRDNSFCLADDLMEPFRPLVDHAVCWLIKEGKKTDDLNRETKSALIAPLLGRLNWADESRTLFDVMSLISASLASIYAGETNELNLPAPLSFS